MGKTAKTAIALSERILGSPALLGLLVWGFLAGANFSCLDNPPYWDDILGLHNQAVWLAEHHFNVLELWSPAHRDSNVYKFGILPYLSGFGYSLFPARVVHILGHLFNMSCLALAFGISYALLRKFRITASVAFLWCAAALSEPVMAGRIAALGQESPTLCAALLSIYFLLDGKYRRSLLFMFLAMLGKMTAGVLAAAFAVWLVTDIFLAGKRWRERLKAVYPYLTVAVLLVGLFLLVRFEGTDKLGGDRILLSGRFDKMKYHFTVLLPVQFTALALMVLVAGGRLIFIFANRNSFTWTEKERASLFLLILTGCFWGAYVFYYCSLPRYSAFIVFPMYIFLALNTFSPKKWRTAVPAAILLIAGMVNIDGAFYRPLISRQLRSGEYLERSREYLTDLRENRTACELLETKYFTRPIVAKWPFVQMLTIPKMGYVTRPLPNVYCACPPINYAPVKVYRPEVKMPDDTLYVFGFNTLEAWTKFGPSLFPRRDKRYKIILKNQLRGGWFIIYEKEPER
ncbi:MAG: hypothetical protein PHH77_03285 [Victivallaceae bacterium]|nr:hypothetical protein [Victivallaceae bacterium]